MTNETALSIRNISKAYRIGLKEQQHDTLGALIASWIKSPINNFKNLSNLSKFTNDKDEDIFWALKDISFTVKKGEVLGIIGRNGAGKSTLLKILSRITEPSDGRVEIYGRVASLLEVGTGFNPELTGRENVYLNGTILGMKKKEIDEKFDQIIEFSGIEKFIDTPAKRYSSGMKVRLAFAVAAHLDPEILVIDEVLAVGDAEFQKKCIGKMQDLSGKNGKTVLFVSHDLSAVMRLCSRALILEKGKIIFTGETSEAVSLYLQNTGQAESITASKEIFKNELYLESFSIRDLHEATLDLVPTGANFSFFLVLNKTAQFVNEDLIIEIKIKNSNGNVLATFSTYLSDYRIKNNESPDRIEIRCVVNEFSLVPDHYSVDMVFNKYLSDNSLVNLEHVCSFEVIESNFYPHTKRIKPHLHGYLSIKHQWIS